ncbi:MAG TPA: serine/threonine-protein kinase, partial [Streptosporangiaceae bacterium]
MLHTEVVLAGRFRLERRIGSGGVGEVWRAVDLNAGVPVAVKVLRSDFDWPPETLTRFRAEARHASSVSHPGIARVYHYDDGDPPVPPYLVMELVMGPSLARVLANGPLEPVRAMDVISQAAAALSAANGAGLVHGDIKPSNLILAQGGQVKITDFGIASSAGSAALAYTGAMLGTPDYMAPECASGLPASWASDLYSLGVVAYECLAGLPPFDGPPLDVATAHRYHPMPPLPDYVPETVVTFVAKLTAKDPRDRPTSADQASWWALQLRDSLDHHPGILPRSWQAGAGAAAGARAAGAGVPDGPPPGPGRGYAEAPARPVPGRYNGAGPVYPAPAGYAEPPDNVFPPPVTDMGPTTLARIEPAEVTGVGPVLPIDVTRTGGDRFVPSPRLQYSRPPYPRTDRRAALYRRRARARSRLAVLLASAAAIAAVLIVMLIMGAFRGSSSPGKTGAAASPRPSTHAPVKHSVLVSAAVLVGKPAKAVRSELRKLGLKPHLVRK